MGSRLAGKRILVTDALRFMGPALTAGFAEEGAEIVADSRDQRDPAAAGATVAAAGRIDVLVANLAADNPRTAAVDTSDDQWLAMYDALVHPLHRLLRAALPQMISRRQGKILVIGSASALRVQPNWSAYASARAAQLAYVRAVAIEAAPHNVQVNAIAQAFVENPTYFSPDYVQTPELKERLRQVPLGRLATGGEDAKLATYLVSDESDFMVGQVIAFAGGWHI